MEDVYIRAAATGQVAPNQPIQLRRIPVKGDFIAANNGRLHVVVRVIHDWDRQRQPVVLCDVAPAEAVMSEGHAGDRPVL